MRALVAAATAVVCLACAVKVQAASGSQAIYDAAQAAYDKGDWTAAAQGFGQLLPSSPEQVSSRSQGVIAYRYGAALAHLHRSVDAGPWLDHAVQVIPADDPALTADAWMIKGEIEQNMQELQAATASFDRADDLLTPGGLGADLLSARLSAAVTGVTVSPAHVRDRLQALLADPKLAKMADASTMAQIEDLLARADVNLGDLEAAAHMSKQAVHDSGGLTEANVRASQIAIRADAAMIARLRKHDEDVSRYMAYTGAGARADIGWVNERAGDLPVCGGPADIVRPDDAVVMSFAIDGSGQVLGVSPTYASRSGALGEVFAQKVAKWHWNPVKIAKVEPFWRSALQLELRCQGRPKLEEFSGPAFQETGKWLIAQGLLTSAQKKFLDAGGWPDMEPKQLEQPDGALLAAFLGQGPRTDADADAIWAKLDARGAPPAVFEVFVETLATKRAGGGFMGQRARTRAKILAAWTPRFASRFPDDPGIAHLHMSESIALEQAGEYALAAPLLAALTAQSSSDSQRSDPVYKVALLHRALVLSHLQDAATAQALIQHSGLTSQSCVLFDTHPILKGTSISVTFPRDALAWGFNGFVLTDFNIDAQGRPTDVRAVVSYPPFIYEESTVHSIQGLRYLAPGIAGVSLGCEGAQQGSYYTVN
jgi:hypothetical protein